VGWPFGRRNVWYAQRGEDRRLAELLRRRRRGFYIDVGAWHPEKDSTTKYFYDRGWRGINVEPHPTFFAMLERERPRDINLNVALGDRPGDEAFTLVGETGLSTFEKPFAASAERWVLENREEPAVVTTVPVRITTLADICRTNVPAGMEIDFLKIDVEGWEDRVLRGADWDAYRPNILVIEAVEPLKDVAAWEPWDAYVRDQRYDFIEFDGLNRWYRRSSTQARSLS
jgi:FkbM family methyltransferase